MAEREERAAWEAQAADFLRAGRRRARRAWLAGISFAVLVVGIVVFALLNAGDPTPQFSSVGSVGRPLRRRWRRRGAAPIAPVEPLTTAAEIWRRAAALEAESVDAFIDLAVQLEAVGAPDDLVVRCHDAARDEVRHAHICRWLVSTVGGPVERRPPISRAVCDTTSSAAPRRGPARWVAVARLGVESYVDGIVGEGLAARHLEVGATTALPGIDQAVERMAADEVRHAVLAVEITQWCLDTSPRLTRAALLGASRRTQRRRGTRPAPTHVDPAELRRCGLVDDETAAAIRHAHTELCASWARRCTTPSGARRVQVQSRASSTSVGSKAPDQRPSSRPSMS